MNDLLRLSVIEQLHPSRIGYAPDGKMTAIVACILGQTWTEPAIGQLTVTSDDYVLASVGGSLANDFLGSFVELSRNWQRLLTCAGLTRAEKRVAAELFRRATGRRLVSGKVPARALPPAERTS